MECSDGTLYCGWTNHLEERIQAHNAGRGAKYTRSRRPVSLVYYETFATKQEAMRREWIVKQMDRQEKQQLIAEWGMQEDTQASDTKGKDHGAAQAASGKEYTYGESKCTGDGELRGGQEYADQCCI